MTTMRSGSTSASTRPAKSRRPRAGVNAADEAQLSVNMPIANWQAKLAWACASWGLIPILGLPLGLLALVFGLLGWSRVRRCPEDLGIRHAIGGVIMGGLEIVLNVLGISFIIVGLLEIRQ